MPRIRKYNQANTTDPMAAAQGQHRSCWFATAALPHRRTMEPAWEREGGQAPNIAPFARHFPSVLEANQAEPCVQISGTMCGRPFLCKEEIGSDD
jgi:hypothetical protein